MNTDWEFTVTFNLRDWEYTKFKLNTDWEFTDTIIGNQIGPHLNRHCY